MKAKEFDVSEIQISVILVQYVIESLTFTAVVL